MEYTVKADGTVELDQDQVTIEDVETPETKDTEDAHHSILILPRVTGLPPSKGVNP
ncbi:hypothetical protein P7H06_15355 [Paenibacillus larvae]|nr:hypothetical protein [Paenibacillus larvae]MDT2260602.1 hypothetical protein [Paenibacillus larvae]